GGICLPAKPLPERLRGSAAATGCRFWRLQRGNNAGVMLRKIAEVVIIMATAADGAGLDVIHPAMNMYLMGGQLGRHHRVRTQMLHLLQYVFFNRFVQMLMRQALIKRNIVTLTHNLHGRTAVTEPLGYVRQGLQLA